MNGPRRLLCVLALHLALCSQALAQSSETTLNELGGIDSRHSPRLAVNDAGHAVLAWVGKVSAAPTSVDAIFARRFSIGAGQFFAEGPQFIVKQAASDIFMMFLSVVTIDDTGRFAVPYVAMGFPTTTSGIETYSAIGTPVSSITLPNGVNWAASVAMDAVGNLTVAMARDTSGSGDMFLQGRRYNASGTQIVGDFPITDFESQTMGSILALDRTSGDFVAVYHHGLLPDVSMRRVSATGTLLGAQIDVATNGSEEDVTDVVLDGSGRIIVAWNEFSGSGADAYVAVYAPDGTLLVPGFIAPQNTSVDHFFPNLAMDSAGNILVVWFGEFTDDVDAVVGRRFDILGSALSGDFRMNVTTAGAQQVPNIASTSGGLVATTWRQVGARESIIGRVHPEATVPVTFAGVHAVVVGGAVEISFEVVADEALAGFQIYRGDSRASLLPIGTPLARDARRFVDHAVEAGRTYHYAVAALTPDGSTIQSPAVEVTVARSHNSLAQNHPNPFNPSTTISYTLERAVYVDLSVFDAKGRLVATLVASQNPVGTHVVAWDGRNDAGVRVASGTYFYRLQAGSYVETRKLVLLK